MAYLVLCTFDLEGARSEDYEKAYVALEKIRLLKKTTGSSGKTVTLPNTVTIGEFEGASVTSVKDEIAERVKKSFNNLELKAKIFITVSQSGWGWTQVSTK